MKGHDSGPFTASHSQASPLYKERARNGNPTLPVRIPHEERPRSDSTELPIPKAGRPLKGSLSGANLSSVASPKHVGGRPPTLQDHRRLQRKAHALQCQGLFLTLVVLFALGASLAVACGGFILVALIQYFVY